MAKSPDAFRTISEVADWLGVEAHVLRFWETKFTQVKPVKRAGGRRYYRPSDMALLGGIRRLLHDDGMTIRGVQKILREQGATHVAAMSPELTVDGVELSGRGRSSRTPSRQKAATAAPRTNGAAPEEENAPTLPFDLPEASPPGRPPEPERKAAPEPEGQPDAPPEPSFVRTPVRPETPDEAPADPSHDAAPAAPPSERVDVTVATDAERPDEAASPAPEPGAAARPEVEALRARVAQAAPADLAPILDRARALAQRLRSTPE